MTERHVVVGSIVIALAVGCGPGSRANDGDDDDSTGCATTCSADLHDVVDCHGNVVESCPAELGCAGNACISACDAAAANQSSIGCDYYAMAPQTLQGNADGACYAAYVANTWSAPVSIRVERDGEALPVEVFARLPAGEGTNMTYVPLTDGLLQPNQVAVLFLARYGEHLTNCPAGITPAHAATLASINGTGRGHAFHITTSAPVVAYDIFPYGGGSSAVTSATLLLPTSAWGVNYVAVTGFHQSLYALQDRPNIALVGAEDNTTITIRPTAAIAGGPDVPPAAQGFPILYSLARGQVLQFSERAELIGSPIESDKPIGLWGGNSCMTTDGELGACDTAHQQIPPVKALGHRYTAVRYRNRFAGMEEMVPWRIVGAVDGTELHYSPAAPPGAPTSLALGQVGEFTSPGQFIVESQDADHPFYLAGYMTGCELASPSNEDCRGDPEFVNVVPNAQYLASYTFFTDPTYPETNLVLTRERKNGTFADVVLDCAGTITGWQPIDGTGDVEYARIDLVTGNFEPVHGCSNGLHVASSAQPFGLVVWGWGSMATGGRYPDPHFTQAVSYAYPAGASVKPINNVVVLLR